MPHQVDLRGFSGDTDGVGLYDTRSTSTLEVEITTVIVALNKKRSLTVARWSRVCFWLRVNVIASSLLKTRIPVTALKPLSRDKSRESVEDSPNLD